MKIIECKEGSLVAKSLERALPVFGIEKNMPLILVNVDIEFVDGGKIMDEIIDEIEADKERPIIFYSFSNHNNQEKLEAKCHGATRLFHRRDVGFIKMPIDLEELKRFYDLLVSGKKIANPAAEAFFSLGVKENLANILLQDLCCPHLIPSVLEKAKAKFGLTGHVEEVKGKLEERRNKGGDSLAKVWEGKTFPGVFCDIGGTLFVDKKLNEEVLEKLKNFAEVKPVTLWTGGDLEEIKKKLVAMGVKYPLVSKDAFEGCEVEIAIDDLAKDVFEKRYRIYSREYIQVKN